MTAQRPDLKAELMAAAARVRAALLPAPEAHVARALLVDLGQSGLSTASALLASFGGSRAFQAAFEPRVDRVFVRTMLSHLEQQAAYDALIRKQLVDLLDRVDESEGVA